MELREKVSELIDLSAEVSSAIAEDAPLLGLETAVLTHGLPRPDNLQIYLELISACEKEGAVPAVIAVMEGAIKVGLCEDEVRAIASDPSPVKIGVRDLPFAISKRYNGGTTVSATARICGLLGIRVMATGGIGGVHLGSPFDVSSDISELARSPVLCVCSGPKSVLDVRATYELLETTGVPVAAYGSDELPSFLSRSSGIKAPWRIDAAEEAAAAFHYLRTLGLNGMVLANPVEAPLSIGIDEIAMWMAGVKRAECGKDVTPMLLSEINELSGGRTVRTNKALLVGNATLGARIACAMSASRPLD